MIGYRFWRLRTGSTLEGISSSWERRQRWTPGVNTATTRCTQDPRHVAPAPGCLCGLYVVPDLATALTYLQRTSWGRAPSTPVAVGAVRTIGDALPSVPRPMGDPASTLRVGAAEIVGPLYLWPDDGRIAEAVAARYGVPVLTSSADFHEWTRGVLLLDA